MKSLSLLAFTTLSLACALPVEASQSTALAKLAFDMREFVRDEKDSGKSGWEMDGLIAYSKSPQISISTRGTYQAAPPLIAQAVK